MDVEAVDEDEDEDADVGVDEDAGDTVNVSWSSLSRKITALNSSAEETENDDHPDVFVKRDRREKHFKARGQRRKGSKK